MTPTRPALGPHYAGLVASLATLLVGGWLILAPFALGYQPYTASWTDATTNDFWVGIGIVLVSLAGLALFARSLVGALRLAGVVQPRPAPAPPATPAGVPAASVASPELERTLVTLAAALAADLAERRTTDTSPKAEPVKIGGLS